MYKIEVDTKSWTIRELLEMYRDNILVMDIPIQRGIVWDSNARSLYIHSALLGILSVQPPFVFSRHITHRDDSSVLSTYSVLDGKQRLTTLIDFIDNEFKLVGEKGKFQIDDTDLVDMKYITLPAVLIQRLLNTSIVCTVVTDPTPEQEDIIFSRLNNNKSMSAIDKIRPQCKLTSDIVNFISDNPDIFRVMFNAKQLNKKPEFEVVIKSLMMLADEPGLSSTHMLNFAKRLTKDTDLSELKYVFTRAYNLHLRLMNDQPDLKSFLRYKAVFLALIPYLRDNSITDDQLIKCITEILTNRLAEFKTGSAHSPTVATVLARKSIIESCL